MGPKSSLAKKPAGGSVAVGKPPTATAGKASPKRSSEPVPSAKPAAKAAKVKLVRNSSTIPSDEYALLDQLKQRELSFGRPARKSELLRAGIKLLFSLRDAALLRALKTVPGIKAGRLKSKHLE